MKKLSILVLSILVTAFTAKAQQEPMPKFPDWDPKPQMHPIPPKYFNEHAVMIFDNETRDYKFEGSDITLYSTRHMLIKVLDRRGIESFNQIPVPFTMNESRVDSIKARTILPDGTTRDLKYEMLYGNSHTFFFALDGVEKNAEIEIMVKYKALSSFFGSINFQHTIPVLHTFFELNYPKEMTFNTKGYHGFPSGSEEMVAGHKQVKIYMPNIPALEQQPQSFYDLYLMRLDYALDHYTTRGGYQNADAYTWDKLAQNLYRDYYNFKKADTIAVGKFLTALGIRGGETDLEKIKMIEGGIKSTIVQYDMLLGKDVNNVDTIINKKSATAYGINRLFCACFRVANINHELGKVSNREEHLLDPKFVNWGPLEYTIFYFPRYNTYLSPNQPYLRYPEIAYGRINNKGVFCKTNPESGYNVGSDVVAPEAIIRWIPAPAANYTKMDMTAGITFNEDFEPEAEVTYAYTGYSAADLRTDLAAASGENKKKIIEKQIVIADKPEKIVRYNTVNEAFNSVYKGKPLEIKATVRVPQLMDKAGNKYMFRIGDVIGSQMNMYDTHHERVLPVDIEYPHTQTRTITLDLPAGCKVLNPQALRIHAEQGDPNNGVVSAYFNSDYTITGNKLTVTITEEYKRLHYTVYEYAAYRKVVNAAADFNKVSLVLEPAKTAHTSKKAKSKVAAVKTPAKQA